MEFIQTEMKNSIVARLSEVQFYLHNAPEKKLTALPNFKMPTQPHQWMQILSLEEGSWLTLAFDELQLPKSLPKYGEIRPLLINGQVQWQTVDGTYRRLMHYSQLCAWLPHEPATEDAATSQQPSLKEVSDPFPTWPPSEAKIVTQSTKTKRKVTVRNRRKKRVK